MNENFYYYYPILLRAVLLTLLVLLVLNFIVQNSLPNETKVNITAGIVGTYILIELLMVIAYKYKDVFCQCETVTVQKDVDLLASL